MTFNGYANEASYHFDLIASNDFGLYEEARRIAYHWADECDDTELGELVIGAVESHLLSLALYSDWARMALDEVGDFDAVDRAECGEIWRESVTNDE